MFNLKSFATQLFNRGSVHIFISGIIGKLLGIITISVLAYGLDKEYFGILTFAFTFVSIFIPLAGIGVDFTLMKFYSEENKITKNLKGYKKLFQYGLFSSIFVTLLLIFSVNIFRPFSENIIFFINLFSAALITEFVFRMSTSMLRIIGRNILYAFLILSRSLILLFLTLFLLGEGYILAIIIGPLVAYIISEIYIKKLPKFNQLKLNNIPSNEIRYGLNVSLGSFLSQALIPLSLIIYTLNINNPENLAEYRIGSAVPLALLFLPNILFKAEFIFLSRNSKNNQQINHYLIQYTLIAMLLLSIISLPLFFYSDVFIYYFAGDNYIKASLISKILFLGIVGAFLLRQPFGNLIFSLGRADINTYITIFIFIAQLLLSFIFIDSYGIIGVAIITSSMFWVGGAISMFFYFNIRN